TEADLSLGDGLELVNLTDRIFHGGDASVGLLRRLLGLVGAIARVERVRISVIGLAHGVANAFGGPRVDVSDHLGVLRGELVQLIHAAADGIQLSVHVLLTGKRIQMSPETFLLLISQRIFASGGLVVGLRRLGLLGLLLVCGSALVLLRNRG